MKYLQPQPFSGPVSNGHKTEVEYAYAVGNATAEDVARERCFLRGRDFNRLPPTEQRKWIEEVIEQG